jgi:FKBP-type peptidyl-prolyl cis-trans isomerase
MRNKLIYPIIVSFLLLVVACGTTPVEQNKATVDKTGEALISVNKYMIKKDVELIKAYIKRHKWNMKESETGLWFEKYKTKEGIQINNGAKVEIKYRLELLDGTLCYSSDSTETRIIKLGTDASELGLEEGLLIMHEGEAARFILPPHLGHGMVGDGNCIQPHSIIVYDVEVIKVERGKN